jgi:(2Fe-2S) ferredoxin
MPQRKRYLYVCVNRRPDGTPKGSCAARGAAELYETLKGMTKERGLAKVEVRVCSSSCLDVCWAGPAIAVEPDHFMYGRVKPEDLEEIVAGLVDDRRVERLVLSPADYELPKELKEKPT